MEEVDLFELNEAFAAQSLAVVKELKCDVKKVNVNGEWHCSSDLVVSLVRQHQTYEALYSHLVCSCEVIKCEAIKHYSSVVDNASVGCNEAYTWHFSYHLLATGYCLIFYIKFKNILN